MAAKFIGVIRSATTGDILAVINPDDDSELDNPRWLLLRTVTDVIEMVKVPRGDYNKALSMDDVAKLVSQVK